VNAPAPPPLFTRYGFRRTGDPAAPLEVEPYPEVCSHGALRATVVASAVDLVGALTAREVAGPDMTMTSDLSLRIPQPGAPARLLAHAEPLRVGRRLVTTAVRLTSDDTTWAYGETSFVRIPRETDASLDASRLSTPESIESHPLTRPLDAEVGIEVVDPATGTLALPLREALRNPEGVLQGALVALLAECAALSLADHAAGHGKAVTELDLRYLSAVSRGPAVSRAHWIGPAPGGMLRVELRDRGRDDRLTATALVRVADAPSP
jgi:acyl-coenzyme A thioesterase PaaI-like protein